MKKYLEFILISLILKHTTKLCKKASQKLHALARMSNFVSCQQQQDSREPSELYIMIIFPRLNNYLNYQELSQFTIGIYNF